jgi:hypothetical protein
MATIGAGNEDMKDCVRYGHAKCASAGADGVVVLTKQRWWRRAVTKLASQVRTRG